jgi:hypothetical protein
MEILPLPMNVSGFDRSRLEAQLRATGLRPGDVSRYWHGVVIHPLTGQHGLRVTSEADKEFFTAAEKAALLTEEEAEDADWFLDFEEDVA